MPLIQENNAELPTFADGVDYLLDTHELSERVNPHTRRARQSLLQAYRDLPHRAAWMYYYRQRLLQTVAPYNTGTVVYTHTGGSSERLVTLTGGTWPAWAAFGRLIVGQVHYEVAERLGNTTLTLTATSNPGADVASTAFTLYRNAYPLPADFRRPVRVYDLDTQREVTLIDAAQQHDGLTWYYDTPQTPWEATVRSTGEYLGGFALVFGPPPDAARTYDVLYVAAPRALAIDQYSTGSVAATGTAVTGTGTDFPANCEGSVIRFSATSAAPSGVLGSLAGIDNPFVAQGIIKTRTSGTALVLEEAVAQTIPAGSGYVISDPLDIEPGAMLTALLKAAEAEFCNRAGRKDAPQKYALARQALLEAMEADSRRERHARVAGYNPYKYTTVTTDA